MAASPGVLVLASNGGAIAAVSVASLVIGYGLLAGLWYFVFSPGAERRAERRRQAREQTQAQAPPPSAPPPPREHEQRPRLRRPARRR